MLYTLTLKMLEEKIDFVIPDWLKRDFRRGAQHLHSRNGHLRGRNIEKLITRFNKLGSPDNHVAARKPLCQKLKGESPQSSEQTNSPNQDAKVLEYFTEQQGELQSAKARRIDLVHCDKPDGHKTARQQSVYHPLTTIVKRKARVTFSNDLTLHTTPASQAKNLFSSSKTHQNGLKDNPNANFLTRRQKLLMKNVTSEIQACEGRPNALKPVYTVCASPLSLIRNV